MSAIYAHAGHLWATMLAEHNHTREAQYAAAVHATNGNMVNAAGRRKRITSWDLYHANRATIARYGTPELIDHLAAHPRTTLAAFERAWLEAHLGGSPA